MGERIGKFEEPKANGLKEGERKTEKKKRKEDFLKEKSSKKT